MHKQSSRNFFFHINDFQSHTEYLSYALFVFLVVVAKRQKFIWQTFCEMHYAHTDIVYHHATQLSLSIQNFCHYI